MHLNPQNNRLSTWHWLRRIAGGGSACFKSD